MVEHFSGLDVYQGTISLVKRLFAQGPVLPTRENVDLLLLSHRPPDTSLFDEETSRA